ncbi:MAG: GNAT family N-acetyltransferase [Candidatus Afipia apatlaquensis]|uniref:GNAT family N-acetyltransferase n=1 Tax=Candidatus Afipia apatlaquensis TaxID=2712852 RepID=A0A7C9VM96_9BRAD|nr:GNAT family N-acetyltransferase [Candidatus Afipia apatlaquensis]
MHVDVIKSRDMLLRVRSNWEVVYQADPEAQLYMSWTWIAGWFEKLGCQWIVLAAKTDANSPDYDGFFPLQLRTEQRRDGTFHNELRTGGGYFAGYTGFICDPQYEKDIITAFADQTKRLNWTRLHLENIFASPERLTLFLNQFPSPGFITEKIQRPDDGDGIDHDIYVYVNLPDSWDAFLYERLDTKARRNARAALRQAEDVEYKITTPTAETIEDDIEALLKFWELQWAAKLAARYNPRLPYGMMNNFRNMLRCCFADNALYLPILWQGENRIGIQASLVDWKNRSLISLLNGRDLNVKRPPPGFVLHLQCVRWGIENGFAVYDLQTGDFPYKYDFGGIERRVECLRVSTCDQRNLRGTLEPLTLPVVFDRALRMKKEGSLEGAAQACRQILDADPRHADAAQLLKSLDAERRRAVPANLATAKGFHQRGQIAEAERAYRAILEAEPKHADAMYLLGVALLQQHKYEAAEQQLRQAIGLQPAVATLHYNRGIALQQLGRHQEALSSFDSALALKPDYSLALAQRNSILKTAPHIGLDQSL